MADETPEPKSGFKPVLVCSMLFAVLGAVVLFAYFATFRRPITTVILVRHAEKIIDPNNADPDLSPAGQARAQELVHMFGSIIFSAWRTRITVVIGRRKVAKYAKSTTAPSTANSIEKTRTVLKPDLGSVVSSAIYGRSFANSARRARLQSHRRVFYSIKTV